jgi:hypothetical protein
MKLFLTRTISFQLVVKSEIDVPDGSTAEQIEQFVSDSDECYGDPAQAEWVGTTYVACRNKYDGERGCEHVAEWDA